MLNRSLTKTFSCIIFLMIGFIELQSRIDSVWASTILENFSINGNPQNSGASQSSWLEKIDTHWGGRLKFIGSLTRADDDTFFEPVGTGTFYNVDSDLRLINETFFSDWGYFEAHYEAILNGGETREKRQELEATFPNFSNTLQFLGAPLNDDRRFMDLTHTVNEENSYILLHRLDRLNLILKPNWGSIRIGRQAITWGNGFIFNPMDLFNPFPPTDIQRDYKVGDDMVTTQFAVPNIGDFQFLYVVRRDPETENAGCDQNSLAGKLHVAVGTAEFDIMGARHFSDHIVGIGSTGYLADAAWRLDATLTLLDDGQGENQKNYISLVANMDYSWTWWEKNFYGLIEYYYNGLGEGDYPGALLNPDITERLARGELFVLGQNYLSGEIQVELHPLFSVFLTLINNIEDPSGIIQPRAVWDITEDLQLKFGANLAWGNKGTEFGGFVLPGTDIRSKAPDNAFVWFNYYF